MKKTTIGLLCILLLSLGVLAACNKGPQPADRLSQYIKLWNEQKFAEMYDFLSEKSQQSITKEGFVERYKKVYNDLEIKELKVQFTKPENEEKAERANRQLSVFRQDEQCSRSDCL